MNIRTKVFAGFLLLLVLFTGVSFYGYFRTKQSHESLVLVNELFLPLSRNIAQLQSNVAGYADEYRRFSMFATGPNTSPLSSVAKDFYPYLIHKKFSAIEQLLQRNDPTTQEISTQLSKTKQLFDQWVATNDQTRFEQIYTEIKAQLSSISRHVEDECQSITRAVQQESRESLLSGLALSLLLASFGIIVVVLSHRALMPLPQLIVSLKKIADGDFHQSLKVRSDKDEVALLAREYNRMLEALRERDKQIQHQQEELLQSERLAAIGQLSAEVVHEIRNPLNSISLNIDWLQAELQASDSEIQKTLRSIAREVERLHQITESYLVRAKVPRQETNKTDLHDLIEEILEFSKEEDRARNIQVEKEFSDQAIFIRSDRSRLKQAFLNVFRNAREAMPQGGTLQVRTEVRDNLIRIFFTDSGYGMNETTKRQAFKPFFTTKSDGTGLGLVLTKTIIEEAHGSISCDSQMGQGTTFTFQFPV